VSTPTNAAPKPAKETPVTTQSAKKNPFGDIKPEDLVVTQQDWDYLAAAIHHIRVESLDMSFLGSMLQNIMIEFSATIPTAMISYYPNKKQFIIHINPMFFRMLTLEERMGLLLHEIYHMTHGHLTRIPALPDRQKANLSADAAINQVIPGIPTREPIRGIFVEDFGLPKDKTLEYYYENWPQQESDDQSDSDEEGDGSGEGGGSGDGEGDGEGQSGNGKGQGKGKPSKGKPGQGKLLDCHDWDPNIDESDVLDGMEEVIKRTMIKTSKTHSDLPGHVKDMLDVIEKRRKAIDWKKQLKLFVKRTTSGVDKEYTRSRPNRRYDYQSPGMRLGEVPKLLILSDTSGSMSIIEINAGLNEIDEITLVGSRKVSFGLWHTGLYKVLKYTRGKRDMVHKSVQSGGTCFEECAQYINKVRPDAVIVFTDGYFNDTRTKVEVPILFVISNGGVKKLETTYPFQRMVSLPPMGE